MSKLSAFFGKCKKGFSLMECVCAVAVVGLLSALILPILSEQIYSFGVAQSLRDNAAIAANEHATQVPDPGSGTTRTLYVTLSYADLGIEAESAFVFTETTSADTERYNTKVSYYELKYGSEEMDPPAED